MFGWEFPPHNSGGLGVACKGLAKALSRSGCTVTFVLPKQLPVSDPDLDFLFAGVEQPDTTPNTQLANPYKTTAKNAEGKSAYTTLATVHAYESVAGTIAQSVDCDVVHAHDWLTYPAGIAAAEAADVPLVSHIHATEHDRSGRQGVDQRVFAIEKEGFRSADHILSVSDFTQNILTDEYGISADKITTAHNGIDAEVPDRQPPVMSAWKQRGNKIVLFLGRQTIQKGPDYFLQAAQKVSGLRDDVLFVMAGSGDMQEELIEMAARMGIGDRVLFPGFVRGQKVDQLYQSADVYVLPSVSEPFGITPLEALLNKTPVLISRQSGVSEVINHALTVDYWDVDALTKKIDGLLRYPTAAQVLSENGHEEVKDITWDDTAQTCLACYQSVMQSS